MATAHKMQRAKLLLNSADTCSYALPCALNWLLQPVLLDSITSSTCCTFSSNLCVAMAEQLCSNPWRNSFVEGKIWDDSSKMTLNNQDWGVGSSYSTNSPPLPNPSLPYECLVFVQVRCRVCGWGRDTSHLSRRFSMKFACFSSNE